LDAEAAANTCAAFSRVANANEREWLFGCHVKVGRFDFIV